MKRAGLEGLCKQSDTHTHTYTLVTNYTKISLVGVCVHVCIMERTLCEMTSSHQHQNKMVAVNNLYLFIFFVKKSAS